MQLLLPPVQPQEAKVFRRMSTPVCTPRKHKAHAQVIADSPLVHWFTLGHQFTTGA